jgi:hypothetical protein
LLVTHEGLKLNDHSERGEELVSCEVTHEIVAPDFILGDTAKLVFYAIQNYVTIGEAAISIYQTKESAWNDACFDARIELGLPYLAESNEKSDECDASRKLQITEKATELISSLKWWSVI